MHVVYIQLIDLGQLISICFFVSNTSETYTNFQSPKLMQLNLIV